MYTKGKNSFYIICNQNTFFVPFLHIITFCTEYVVTEIVFDMTFI